MNAPGTSETVFYKGNSMRGVFVPGEMLVLSETAFETLRTGDVVAMFGRTPHVIHRIIGKNADSAVTMGDNNDRPDAMELTADVPFRLVTGAISMNGAIRPVAGGEAGMRQFRRQQRKRKLSRAAGLLARPLKPLKFMRIPARRETRFLDGTVQWSFAGIPVAAHAPSGRFMYLHWSKRLFFRVSSSSRNGARSPERTEG